MAIRYSRTRDTAMLAVAMTAVTLLIVAPVARALTRPKDLQIVVADEYLDYKYQVRHKDGAFYVFYKSEDTSGMVRATDTAFPSVQEATNYLFVAIEQAYYEGLPCNPMEMPPEGLDCFEDPSSPTGFSFRMIG